MPFTFEEQLAAFRRRGFARPTRFELLITPPSGLRGVYTDVRSLSLYADSASIPGEQMRTVPFHTYGPSIVLPVGKEYGVWPVTFKLSEEMTERTIFREWFDIIENRDSYNIAFYNDYVTDIEVCQKDLKNEISERIILRDAYPTKYSDLEVGDGERDKIHMMTVSFTYHRWEKIYATR